MSDVPAVGRSGFIFTFPGIHLYQKIPVQMLSPCRGPERYVLPVCGTEVTEAAGALWASGWDGRARAGAGSDTAYQENYALRKRSDADLPAIVQDVFNKSDNG